MACWICEVCENENLHTMTVCEVCQTPAKEEALRRAKDLAFEEEQRIIRQQLELELEARRQKRQEAKEKFQEKCKQIVAIGNNNFLKVLRICSVCCILLVLLGVGGILVKYFAVGDLEVTRKYFAQTLTNLIMMLKSITILPGAESAWAQIVEFSVTWLDKVQSAIELLIARVVNIELYERIADAATRTFDISSEQTGIGRIIATLSKNAEMFYRVVTENVNEIINMYFE